MDEMNVYKFTYNTQKHWIACEPHDTLHSGSFYVNFSRFIKNKTHELEYDDWLAETDWMSNFVVVVASSATVKILLSLWICYFIFYFDYYYDYCFCILNKSEKIFFFLQTAAALKVEKYVVEVEKSKYVCVTVWVFFPPSCLSCLYNKYKSSVLPLHTSLNRS